MVKRDNHRILSLSFLGFFSIPTVKFRLKPQLFQQHDGGRSRTPGVFRPAVSGDKRRAVKTPDGCAGERDDTAAMIFRDESIVTLAARPIITSASKFPAGKSKTSGVEMSWECAVQRKMGWRLPGRPSSALKSTFMLMNKQSARSFFFTPDLLLTAPKTHH